MGHTTVVGDVLAYEQQATGWCNKNIFTLAWFTVWVWQQ
jgi:hypothetical protein